MTEATIAAAYEAAREGMARASSSAGDDWCCEALDAILLTAFRLPEFICDDIWRESDLRPGNSPRALGPVLRKARDIGICEKTDRLRPSARSNTSGKPVWRSLVYSE